MKGIVLAEQGHIVNALPPINITGGALSDRWSMKNHAHATIIVSIGVSAAAFTKIILNAATAASGGSKAAIGSRYAAEETAAGDTLGSLAAFTSAGITPSANDTIMYVLEVDASELPDGSPWLEVELTNGTNSVIAAVIVVLTGSRYQGDQNQTAIA